MQPSSFVNACYTQSKLLQNDRSLLCRGVSCESFTEPVAILIMGLPRIYHRFEMTWMLSVTPDPLQYLQGKKVHSIRGVVCLTGAYPSPCVKKETPSSLENPGGGNESFEHHMDTTEKSNFLNLFYHPGTSTSARQDRTFYSNDTFNNSRQRSESQLWSLYLQQTSITAFAASEIWFLVYEDQIVPPHIRTAFMLHI